MSVILARSLDGFEVEKDCVGEKRSIWGRELVRMR